MTRGTAIGLMALNLLVGVTAAAGTSLWMQRSAQPVLATLDIAALYRLKEQQVAAILVQRNSTEADRLQAIQQAAAFGARVSEVLESLPQECACLVLAPGAILGSSRQLRDLTPGVRARLGLEIRP